MENLSETLFPDSSQDLPLNFIIAFVRQVANTTLEMHDKGCIIVPFKKKSERGFVNLL